MSWLVPAILPGLVRPEYFARNPDIAFFVDNVTDEVALLALDQERGRAGPGRLPDEPAAHLRRQHPHRLLNARARL